MFTIAYAYIRTKDRYDRLPNELFFATAIFDFITLFALIAYIGTK